MAYHQNETINQSTILNYAFPIGSLYFSLNDSNPENFLGGKWKPIQGYYLEGVNIQGTTEEGKKAGEYYNRNTYSHDHTLSSCTLTAEHLPRHNHLSSNNTITSKNTSTDGSHTHTQQGYYTLSDWTRSGQFVSRHRVGGDPTDNIGIVEGGSHTHSMAIETKGGTSTHTHTIKFVTEVPLYFAVYIWERIE